MTTTKENIDYTNIYRCLKQSHPETSKVLPSFRNLHVFSLNISDTKPHNACRYKSRMDAGFFHYHGSFTTPPCNESVQYLVMNSPVQVGNVPALSPVNLHATASLIAAPVADDSGATQPPAEASWISGQRTAAASAYRIFRSHGV